MNQIFVNNLCRAVWETSRSVLSGLKNFRLRLELLNLIINRLRVFWTAGFTQNLWYRSTNSCTHIQIWGLIFWSKILEVKINRVFIRKITRNVSKITPNLSLNANKSKPEFNCSSSYHSTVFGAALVRYCSEARSLWKIEGDPMPFLCTPWHTNCKSIILSI